MTDHLGYEKHDRAGRDGGNSRNGSVGGQAGAARSACGMSSASRVSSRVAPGAGAGRERQAAGTSCGRSTSGPAEPIPPSFLRCAVGTRSVLSGPRVRTWSR